MTDLKIILTVLIFQYVRANHRVDPLLDTKLGLIRGLRANDGAYSMFLGIPYAKVNVSNPFGPSTPYPKFDEIFEANDDSAICPQIEEFKNTIGGTIDCLHLNVYVPNSASSRNRVPVLIWIHGGGFARGTAGRYLYGPKYLVRHDIILVTLNYRLGPYGFMCLDNPDVPGNQGIKDQQLAFRWINENIESFGGDISKITIFGQSAGSMSIDLHLMYGEQKLFNNVIMESGTTSVALSVEPDISAPIKIAHELGFTTDDISNALSFLSTVDPKLVIAASSKIRNIFFPCVEKKFDGVENFISDYPVNKNVPKARGMQILIGFNSHESIPAYEILNSAYFDFEALIKTEFEFSDDELTEMEKLVRIFYTGEENSEIAQTQFSYFVSDFQFNYPTETNIAKFVANGADNVFHYVFSYNGGRNLIQRMENITAIGAIHSDEIGYLFDIASWTEQPTEEDQLTLDRVTEMWTNFAKYGNPTPETSELLPVKWEPITKDSVYHYLNIDADLTLQARPYHERMAFWDLFYMMNEKLQKGYREQ